MEKTLTTKEHRTSFSLDIIGNGLLLGLLTGIFEGILVYILMELIGIFDTPVLYG